MCVYVEGEGWAGWHCDVTKLVLEHECWNSGQSFSDKCGGECAAGSSEPVMSSSSLSFVVGLLYLSGFGMLHLKALHSGRKCSGNAASSAI